MLSGLSYKKVVKEKNCFFLVGEMFECLFFEYYCVLSDDWKYVIEVCVLLINIVGMNILIIFYINYFNFFN